MTGEFVTPNESHPSIQPAPIKSTAEGSESIARVLGSIAQRGFTEAADYAKEASKANLLQSHSMIQDVDAQSKIDMARSPGNATHIAKNANDTIQGLLSRAELNKNDRLNLRSMAQNTARSLNVSAAEKEIALTRESAKFNTLSSFATTLQSIRTDIFNNPEQADALIEAQYEAIRGKVQAGIITAVEGANLHKQFTAEMQMAQEIVEGMKEGVLTASDLSAYHATDTGQVPLSNANLPMATPTAMNAEHHFGMLTINDIESRIANGERVMPKDLIAIKNPNNLDKVLNYGMGAARATGDINSGMSWIELNHKLDLLRKTEKLSGEKEGYKNRLNNFITNAKEPGWYQNFIAGTPEGARMYQAFSQTETAIDNDVPFGTPEQVNVQKYIRHNDNLNDLITKSDSLGIGMHIPDYLRQPIPREMLAPIVGAFNKGGDIQTAIQTIQRLTPKNRVYAMNAFKGGTQDDYRKQLTVFEAGSLANKADPGFLVDLMASQQADALGRTETAKNKQNKFTQLDQSKSGKSDQKLRTEIKTQLTDVNTYLRYQPNGAELESAKVEQALRYVKKQAADHGDYEFKNTGDYLQTFKNNMNRAYGVKSSYNYVLDANEIPLEEPQMQVLASHALNETRKKLLEYNTPKEVDTLWANNPPMLSSSPGGRVEVIFTNGHAVPDKYGTPAYSELYNENIWRKAESDTEITGISNPLGNAKYGNAAQNPETIAVNYLRANPKVIRPLIEGNIDLENRPKVYDKNGNYETVKTMTIEQDGKTVLIPQIVNGKLLSKKEAIEHYKDTQEHLGIFKNEKEADEYDKQLHIRHGWIGEMNKWGK
jgi:hypothetical protein